jgi:hypothetical protein
MSVLLLKANGDQLERVLDFYEEQTTHPPKALFEAMMAGLLSELMRFLGNRDTEEAERRWVAQSRSLLDQGSLVGQDKSLLTSYSVMLFQVPILNKVIISREHLHQCQAENGIGCFPAETICAKQARLRSQSYHSFLCRLELMLFLQSTQRSLLDSGPIVSPPCWSRSPTSSTRRGTPTWPTS